MRRKRNQKAPIADLPSGVSVLRTVNGAGKEFWRIRLGKRFTGGTVVKKDFPVLADARSWFFGDGQLKRATPGSAIELKQKAGAAAFVLTPAQLAEAAAAYRTLDSLGTLSEAVAFFVKHARPRGGIKSFQEAGTEYLAFLKNRKNRSDKHLKGLRSNYDRFAEDYGDVKIHLVRKDTVENWLDDQDNVSAKTRANYLRDLYSLFEFAVEQKSWCAENPCKKIEKPEGEAKDITFLRPNELESLLTLAVEHETSLVAGLALKAFAGLRTSELLILDWSKIGDSQIEISASQSKTRRRRLVSISENLKVWLAQYRKEKGPVVSLSPNGWHDAIQRTTALADEPLNLPSNVLRHSFCSYHYAKYKNENLTAAEAGNSPAVIFNHYRALVPVRDVDAYWSVLPADKQD
ncbi:MAG TPA: hypothetical protein VG733_04275 [Chthoniobacteraceae bacterium]|nr:hypothetical protein [Chthoniobacteraceae bacterium]